MSGAVKESSFIPLLILVLLVVSTVNSELVSDTWSSYKIEELVLKHTWVVNNFNQIYTLEYINSPNFWPPNYEHFKWYIRLYPRKGNSWESYLSLRLYHNDSSTVNVNYTFSIGPEVRSGSDIFKGVDFWERGFMKTPEVFNHIQPNGDLLINCEIRMPINVLMSTGSGKTIDSSNSTNNQTCTSKIHNDFANLLKDEKYSDVTIVIEGNNIRAHRNILAVRSPVLASLLLKNDTNAANCNCNSSSLEIKDVKLEVFRKLLIYIYTDEVDNVDGKMAKDLLVAAIKYDIQGLKTMCEEILCSDLNGANAVEILVIAAQQNMSKLKLCASKFIAEHV